MSNAPTSTIYGPVRSWRVGQSLGVDLLFKTSICSFRCIYCQLGKIEDHTAKRDIYVSTEKVMADLEESNWREADIITFSGSGEPTLAANLPEVIHAIKARTGKPVMVLTNATMLNDPQVRLDLLEADKVFCKLDAADDRMLQLIDRPVPGVTVRSIVDGIKALRAEFKGYLAIQAMFMPQNTKDVEAFAGLLNEIKPDEVQLNTPLRPVPKGWYIEARGNHERESAPYESYELKHLSREDAVALEARLRELTGLKIVSVYKD
ncbi:MAG: Radical domain protein [Cyanobacteria bacterium RYN_339]|nr:Radical domain protein [Cyanobacteria bacterium RYN_339]